MDGAGNGRLLIVEDEPDMCWAMGYLPEKQGYAIARAISGRQALRLLRSEEFKMAFLGAKLPDVDGLELARRIGEIDPAIRVVLVSGYDYREDAIVQEALRKGWIGGFIAKPFLHQDFLRAIAPETERPQESPFQRGEWAPGKRLPTARGGIQDLK